MVLLDNRIKERVILELSLRDLLFDRKVSLCIIATVLAVVAPLLLLFGLKFGVVSQMRQELLADPRNLEIRLMSSADLAQSWFDHVASVQGVGFIMPLTRSLNTMADLQVNRSTFIDNVELIPTRDGDPLRSDKLSITEVNSVMLSYTAASRLAVKTGDSLELSVSRILDGRSERGRLTVVVASVLEPAAFPRPAALVSLPLLIAVEDFLDGFQVPLLNSPTGKPLAHARDHFARARIYAKTLDDVEVVAKLLKDQGIETSTRLADILSVKAIDRVLDIIFSVIAWTAVLGCAASMTGAFMANIDRKRKDLALLRLMGFGRDAMRRYVVVQSVTLTLIGFLVGCLAYWLCSVLFNFVLGPNFPGDTFVCRLDPIHFAVAFASALAVAVGVATLGAATATRIDPAESLRDI